MLSRFACICVSIFFSQSTSAAEIKVDVYKRKTEHLLGRKLAAIQNPNIIELVVATSASAMDLVERGEICGGHLHRFGRRCLCRKASCSFYINVEVDQINDI